jgi:hypothetical protein
MRDAKRRHHRHQPDETQPTRPARRITMSAQHQEDYRLTGAWPWH